MIKPGRIIIPAGTFPEKHELRTANFFAERGKDVEFIKPCVIKGLKNPDIKMDGIIWEIKVPIGKSKRTIENNYRTAQTQSKNIIFDLRQIELDEKIAVKNIKQQFVARKRKVSRILVIQKNSKLLDLFR